MRTVSRPTHRKEPHQTSVLCRPTDRKEETYPGGVGVLLINSDNIDVKKDEADR